MATNTRKQYDLVIYKGRDFKMNVYFKDANGDAVDLTGWSGKAQVRESMLVSSTLIFEMTVNVADATAGKVTVSVSDTLTQVTQERGNWDLMMTDDTGYDDSYIIGIVTLVDVPTQK